LGYLQPLLVFTSKLHLYFNNAEKLKIDSHISMYTRRSNKDSYLQIEKGEEPVSLRRIGLEVEEAVAALALRRRLIHALSPCRPSCCRRRLQQRPPVASMATRQSSPWTPVAGVAATVAGVAAAIAVVATRPLAAVPHLGFGRRTRGGDWGGETGR
jgi:hypothetical protein